MTTEKESQIEKNLRRVMSQLELTAKNQTIAEQYLDLSKPEDADLLKEVEHQNFHKLERNTRSELNQFLEVCKEGNAELADRYIRLVAEIGRETSQCVLARLGLFKELEYLKQILPPALVTAIQVNAVAWDFRCLTYGYIKPLIEQGIKDPEIFQQAGELCCNNDGVNTRMLLAALYLHCVKPLEESKGRLCIPPKEDNRAAGDPGHIKETTKYLENRLINNIDGLFAREYEPEGEDLKTLQDFVRSADLEGPIPREVWAVLSDRRKFDYLTAFLSFLAILAVEHSDRFVAMLRLTVALDFMSVENIPLDKCLETGDDWFRGHIAALEKVLEIPDDIYIRWALLRRLAKILERMSLKAPEAACEVLKDVSVESAGFLRTCIKTGNPQLYEEMEKEFADSYHRAAAEQAVREYKVKQEEAKRYLLGETEIEDILPCVADWRDMGLFNYRRGCQNIHDYMVFGELQIYRRALVLECLRLCTDYISLYWVDAELDRTDKTTRYKKWDVCQVNGILKVLEEEKVPPQYQIEFLGYTYDSYYVPEKTSNDGDEHLKAIVNYHKDWHQEWVAASKSRFLPARRS